MTSRLLKHNKVLIPILLLFFLAHNPLYAQNFDFSFLGPDTIFVGSDCTAPYEYSGDSIQIISTINANIQWEYDYDRAGVNYGDPIQANHTVTMYVPTWDDQNNTDTFTFDIYFVDTISPVFDTSSLPTNYPFYVSLADVPNPPTITATDNCGPVSITFNQSTLTDTCAGGDFFRVWTATDTFGNQSIFTQTLILQPDETPPQISNWPTNGQSACQEYGSNFPIWLAQNMNLLDPTDQSGIASISNNAPTSLPYSCDTTILVTFSVFDSCGNVQNATANYHVVDTTAPRILNLPKDTTYNCNAIQDPLHLHNGLYIEDCDTNLIEIFSESTTQNTNIESCSHYNFTIIRNWSIKDHCGNTTDFQQIITVQDTTPPEFVLIPLDTSVQCQDFPIFQDLLATEQCSIITYQKNENITLGTCTDSYEAIRTWTAEDACGNQTSTSQRIFVTDTIAPKLQNIPNDVTVNCSNIPILPTITALDSCDNNVTVVVTETTTRSSDTLDCAYYNYTITRNWIAVDNCGNSTQDHQIITVKDDEAPTIICPSNIVLPNDSMSCDKTINLPDPASYFDNCTFQFTTNTTSQTIDITIPPGSNANDTPVNLDIQLTPNSFHSIAGNITLKIDLIDADAEATSEYFYVFGEDSTLIGQTNQTPIQCGNSSTTFTNITIPQLSKWLKDGSLNLVLISAGIGQEAINAICPTGKVNATLTFDQAISTTPLNIEYSINQGNKISWPEFSQISFPQGSSTIRYFAEDCSGNKDSCFFNVQIQDIEPPIIECPSNQVIYVNDTECSKKIQLPYPLAINDNCSFSNTFSFNSDTSNIIFESNGNAGIIPKTSIYNITGVQANAISDATLNIAFKGHNTNTGQHFLIYGESNTLIGQTQIGTISDECTNFTNTVVTILKDSLNSWATDGNLTIQLIPETDATTYTDFIHPCGNLNANQEDGISKIELSFQYDQTTILYKVGDTTGYVYAAKPTTLTLPVDTYSIQYSVVDINGLNGICNWTVEVLDTIAPIAIAANTIVTSNPSGTTTTTINPNIVNNGSYDNCEILNMTLNPSTFSCDQAGNTVSIILTVTDASGNIGIDTAQVQIQNEQPQPVFTQGVCGNDTLFLYANPPSSNGANVYSYQWEGPNGFTANTANPFIANPTSTQTGSYSVTITGFTGCTSFNSVQVQLNALPEPPVLTTNTTSLCPGDSIILSTQGFAGSTVNYFWYEGTPPNGFLIGTTSTNAFKVPNPTQGNSSYYAIVNINGCTSSQSNIVNVEINPILNLQVAHDSLLVCQGQQATLEVINPNPYISYNWSGPLFSSQDPNTFFLAENTDQTGTYIITAQKNGCIYQPDTTFVQVHQRPEKPNITNNHPFCDGDTLNINISNYTTPNIIHWINPTNITTTVQQDNFQIIGDSTLAGNWTIYADDATCTSEQRIIIVNINQYPELSIQSVGPVCEGAPITLNYNSNLTISNQTWTTPDQLQYFNQSIVTTAKKGMYHLSATSSGCESKDSIYIDPKIAPLITAISNTSDGCFDGEMIQLKPTVFPADTSYTYLWTSENTSYSAIDPEPFISNADESINGYYYLVVTDSIGCQSEKKSTLVTGKNKPQTPFLTVLDNTICTGDSTSLLIENYTTSSASTFNWITPKGTFSNTSNTFKVPNSTNLDMGNYSVIITQENCPSDTSVTKFITVKPRPPKPTAITNSPICQGDVLQLSTNPISGALYHWSNPSLDSIYNPTLSNVQQSDAGTYTVQTILDNCFSEISNPVSVSVKELPLTPIIIYNTPICQEGGEINLKVDENTKIPGAKYTWLHQGNDTIGATSFFTQHIENDLSNYNPGSNQFLVTTFHNECTSVSIPISIQIDTIPINQADAGLDIDICENQEIFLNAQWPTTGTGMWKQICGPTASISNPDTSITTIFNISADTYCFEWILSNGGCRNYDKDTVNVKIIKSTIANAGDFIDTCEVSSLFLDAENPQNPDQSGKWALKNSSPISTIKIINSNQPNTQITGLEKGNIYTFYWTLEDIGCGTSTDSITVRIAGGKPDAGPDQYLCSLDSCITLNAQPLQGQDNGQWSTFDSASEINNPSNETSSACNLALGPNPFVWTINNGACGTASKDTVIINFQPTPKALPDTFKIEYGIRAIIDVSTNDVYTNDYSVSIINLPNHCKVISTQPNGHIKLEPREGFAGLDSLTYKICNTACNSCTVASVQLRIGAFDDCKIPTIFTPDQDGINDYLIIPCLLTNSYPDSQLSIFNQWGDEIYHAKNYQNNWDGTYKGTQIQQGTYYYILSLGSNNIAPKKGFITIKY